MKALFNIYFHIEHVLDICENRISDAILTNIQNIYMLKY